MSADFDAFWRGYPRKVGKADAARAWAKLAPPLAEVLAALEWQRRSPQWLREMGAFVPHPATWLNRAGWQDEPDTEKPVMSVREIQTQSAVDGFLNRRKR